jgi:hypothetical protein
VDAATKCPKCLRLLRERHDQTVGWCPRCERWQFIYQSDWRSYGEAQFQHLGCVACGDGAWCRDLVERPDAGGCAYGAHVHGIDEACAVARS